MKLLICDCNRTIPLDAKAAADISARFIKLHADEVDGAFVVVLRRIAETLTVDRAVPVRIPKDAMQARVTHSGAVQGIRQVARLCLAAGFPWLTRRIVAARHFSFGRRERPVLGAQHGRRAGARAVCLAALLVSIVASIGEAGAAQQQTPVRVLIINSLGRENSPYEVFASAFRSELAQRVTAPVAFYETSLDGARFDPARDSAAFVRFLADRFEGRPPDLVVPIGPLAARFYAQHRERLFPGVPMLVAVAERRIMQSIAMAPGDASMTQNANIALLVENILQVLPATAHIAFIIGNSPIEQFWAQVARAELAPFGNRVSIDYLNGLSLEQAEERVAALPPNSAVLFTHMFIDGAGVSREHDPTLARIRAAARAPIFGLYESQLGKGIVGGPLLSEREAAVRTAELARRMFAGQAPGPAQSLSMGEPVYDARELARWGIPDARLPQPSTIVHRQPPIWQQYRAAVIAPVAVRPWPRRGSDSGG